MSDRFVLLHICNQTLCLDIHDDLRSNAEREENKQDNRDKSDLKELDLAIKWKNLSDVRKLVDKRDNQRSCNLTQYSETNSDLKKNNDSKLVNSYNEHDVIYTLFLCHN